MTDKQLQLFQILQLNPSEIKHYGFTTGYQVGKFKKSEDHPQNKLIRDVAVMIAAIIGGGYAIQQLQGEKIKKQEGARSLSHNQDPQLITGGGGAGGGGFVILGGNCSNRVVCIFWFGETFIGLYFDIKTCD